LEKITQYFITSKFSHNTGLPKDVFSLILWGVPEILTCFLLECIL
jgi:hypothetical protein